jgi:hypothetical protein
MVENLTSGVRWANALNTRRSDMSPTEILQLDAALDTLSEVDWELWNVLDADELDRRSAKRDLDDATRSLARLNRYLDASLPGDLEVYFVQASSDGIRGALRDTPGISDSWWQELGSEPEKPELRAAWIQSRNRFWDHAVLILLFALAVYTGLTTLYFDKAFGTLRDYLSIFAWGAGSKAAVEVLGSVLDSIRARLAWPASTSAAPAGQVK